MKNSRKQPSEHAEQVTFVQWFRLSYPGVIIFAIPSGGQRNDVTGAKLKAEGVLRGVPDLYIPAWRTWIEMKRGKGGKLSPEQVKMIDYLRGIGDTVHICAGAAKAMEACTERVSAARGQPVDPP